MHHECIVCKYFLFRFFSLLVCIFCQSFSRITKRIKVAHAESVRSLHLIHLSKIKFSLLAAIKPFQHFRLFIGNIYLFNEREFRSKLPCLLHISLYSSVSLCFVCHFYIWIFSWLFFIFCIASIIYLYFCYNYLCILYSKNKFFHF